MAKIALSNTKPGKKLIFFTLEREGTKGWMRSAAYLGALGGH